MTFFKKIKYFFIPTLRKQKLQILQLAQDLAASKRMCQRFEDLLTNKNASCTEAQRIFITDHAIHRYKERGGFTGTNEDLRKKMYKLLARHLLVLDKLADGEYDLDKNIVCRVKDNTAVTCMTRRGSKRT